MSDFHVVLAASRAGLGGRCPSSVAQRHLAQPLHSLQLPAFTCSKPTDHHLETRHSARVHCVFLLIFHNHHRRSHHPSARAATRCRDKTSSSSSLSHHHSGIRIDNLNYHRHPLLPRTKYNTDAHSHLSSGVAPLSVADSCASLS